MMIEALAWPERPIRQNRHLPPNFYANPAMPDHKLKKICQLISIKRRHRRLRYPRPHLLISKPKSQRGTIPPNAPKMLSSWRPPKTYMQASSPHQNSSFHKTSLLSSCASKILIPHYPFLYMGCQISSLGATDYIAAPLAPSLLRTGTHYVYGVVRRPEAAKSLLPNEVTPVIGSVSDIDFLKAAITEHDIDVIINCTSAHDVSADILNAIVAAGKERSEALRCQHRLQLVQKLDTSTLVAAVSTDPQVNVSTIDLLSETHLRKETLERLSRAGKWQRMSSWSPQQEMCWTWPSCAPM